MTLGMLVALALTGCSQPAGSDVKEKVVLFNGQNLNGWVMVSLDPNRTMSQTWTVRDHALCCAGRPNGYLRTDLAYQDYHLHLEWRWAVAVTNSGLLIHGQQPDQIWPKCIQCQLKKDRTGDLIAMNGATLTVDGHTVQAPEGKSESIPRRGQSAEKAQGQWNAYDVYCEGGRIRTLVNGVLQGEAVACTPASGWIGLQGEAGPIEFRNIELEPLGR